MVVFPDPPFELITSVVFILMSFAPFPYRATGKRQDYAKVIPYVINYFTGDPKKPPVGLVGFPGGLPEDPPASYRMIIRSIGRHSAPQVKLVSIRFAIATLTGRYDFANHWATGPIESFEERKPRLMSPERTCLRLSIRKI